MMAEAFRLPGSTYEELVNIIVAYGTRDDAANPRDVGKLNSVHQSSVSRNNAFLKQVGVVRGEREKLLVTQRGRSLALALARRDEERTRGGWRELVSGNEFLQNVVSAVKLREGMLYPTVQAYIAHAAGQPRNKPVMNGAGAIVEILKAAGLLREDEGEIVALFDEPPAGESAPARDTFETVHEAPEDGLEDDLGGVSEREKTGSREPAGTPVSAVVQTNGSSGVDAAPVQIHLHVRCAPDEIEDLGPRLKALLRDLARP